MWGLAETQLKIVTDDMARERAAARDERIARAATVRTKGKRWWQTGQRAPDRDTDRGVQRRTAHRAWAPR